MSGASLLNLRWKDCATDRALPVSPGQMATSSQRVRQGERNCPLCDSIVYSRRHRWCGVCGQVLPEDCRFTAREAQSVEMLLRTEQQRHRAWLKKATGL